jgi:hypothetical protein
MLAAAGLNISDFGMFGYGLLDGLIIKGFPFAILQIMGHGDSGVWVVLQHSILLM